MLLEPRALVLAKERPAERRGGRLGRGERHQRVACGERALGLGKARGALAHIESRTVRQAQRQHLPPGDRIRPERAAQLGEERAEIRRRVRRQRRRPQDLE
jgi:hypothetical protein